METKSGPTDGATDATAPRAVRYAVGGGLGLLLGSAAYLISVRGEALFVDLASIGSRAWCF
jgi:hypothetical protein